MNITEFTAIPAIVVAVYLAAYFIKTLSASEAVNRLLPPICGLLGLILGIVCYFTLPEYITAENWLAAAAVGIASGFAATGVNQVFKQMKKTVSDDEADGREENDV